MVRNDSNGDSDVNMIKEGWKKVIIPVQHMFPNCQVKYKTKCTDIKSCSKDKEFWDSIERKLKQLKEADIEVVRQELRRERIKLEHTKPPEGFENCIDTLLAFLQLQKNLGN